MGDALQLRLKLDWIDRDKAAASAAIDESHLAINLGEKGIVASPADIEPWFQLRAALANEDRAPGNDLSRKTLYSKPLGI
jgi:hypothetical protein